MDSNDFLSAVLPSQGKYCVFTASDTVRKNLFVDDIDNLYKTSLQLDHNGQQTYYALSTFDTEGYRKAANAQWIRTLAMDLDCGAGKAFPNKRDAITALTRFIVASRLEPLGDPWLVDSGGGVHVYWPLDKDHAIDEWKPVAEKLKRLASKLAFNIDMTVTADAARVLRMPGMTNWKYTPPKPVVLKHRGHTFSLQSIDAILDTHNLVAPPTPPSAALALPGNRPGTALSPIAAALIGNSATYFKGIVVKTSAGEGCGQLLNYFGNATEDGMEPTWRGLLSWTKVCVDGDSYARKLSKLHPYDEDRMALKLSEIRGPYPCAKMDSERPGICGQCQHWGKITNPLVWGRKIEQSDEMTVVVDTPTGPTSFDRPEAPYGFFYGANGGVFFRKKGDKKGEEDRDLMLIPYDLFMTRMFRDGVDRVAEFKAIKGNKTFTFAVPLSKVASPIECIKTLAANNIIAVHMGYDQYLYQYVRQSIQTHSATGTEVDIPPRLGWQDDSSLAVGDTVYSPHSPQYNYTYVSDRMQNLMRATTCEGTLQGWQDAFYMLRNKAAQDPMVWGHLAVAGAGFGSLLMQFMPAGARAATIHVCSISSGSGKTLAQTLAASPWGDGERYRVAPSTSERTMMQRAGLYGSLPLCVDEITQSYRESNREWLPKFIFDFSAGTHKIKGSASGNNEILHDVVWSSIAIITSNAPGLEAMMGARSHTSEGEARRHLEWELPRSYSLTWTAEEDRVRKLISANYGVAGRMFAQWCVLNTDKVREVLAQMTALWTERARAKDDERFWTALVVSILAGYILAGPKYANVLEMPVSPILDFWLGIVNRARGIISGNQSSALDVLNSYIREHSGNFVHVQSNQVLQQLAGKLEIQPNTDKQAIRGRIEYDVTPGHVDFYVEAKLLKVHCAGVSMSYTTFIEELRRVAVIIEGPKNLLAGTKGPTMRVQCVKITRPISALNPNDI
jgi:hypothetical protein